MKITPVQQSFTRYKCQDKQLINKSRLQDNVSFGTRIFTPQQLTKCSKIIEQTDLTSKSLLVGCVFGGIFSGGFGLLGIPAKNAFLKVFLATGLGETLKLSTKDITNLNEKIKFKSIFFDVKEYGKEFIEKAAKLD